MVTRGFFISTTGRQPVLFICGGWHSQSVLEDSSMSIFNFLGSLLLGLVKHVFLASVPAVLILFSLSALVICAAFHSFSLGSIGDGLFIEMMSWSFLITFMAILKTMQLTRNNLQSWYA